MKTLEEAIALRDELEQTGEYDLVYADHVKELGFVAIAITSVPGERNGTRSRRLPGKSISPTVIARTR